MDTKVRREYPLTRVSLCLPPSLPSPARGEGTSTHISPCRFACPPQATAAAIGRGLTTYSRSTLSLESTSISETS